MPGISPPSATKLFESSLAAVGRNYIFTGKIFAAERGPFALVEHVWDPHGHDLTTEASHDVLATAVQVQDADAVTAAAAIALDLICRTTIKSNGAGARFGPQRPPLSNDLLLSAGEIALFALGRDDTKSRRAVYHWAECGNLPIGHWAGILMSLRSLLQLYVDAQLHRPAPANDNTPHDDNGEEN